MADDRSQLIQYILRARDEASRIIARVEAGFGGLKTAVVGAMAAITAYLGAKGLTDFFTGALASAKDFEAQLSVVKAATGATAAELATLKAAAEEAGAATRFTATEAAQGLEILAKAGLSAAEAAQALPTVLALAQGQAIDMATAAGLVTDNLSILGLEMTEAARVADVLTTAANLSNTSATELGNALSYAGAEARTAGLTLEQTAAILDVLAAAGLRGERAGTGLRSVLGQLGDPASKARRELAALGITSGELNTVIAGLTGAGARGEAAIRAFGVEAGPTVRALLAQGTAGVAEFQAKLEAAGGAAQTAAAVMDDNLDGALAGLASAWDALSRALVEPLLGRIAEEARGLAAALRTAATDGTLEAFKAGLVDAFEAAVKGIKGFLATFDFKAASDRLGTFVRDLGAQFHQLVSDAQKLGAAITLPFSALATSLNAILSGVTQLGSYFQDYLALLLKGAASLGLVGEETAATFTKAADTMREKAIEFAGKSIEAYQRTTASLNTLLATTEDVAAGHDRMAAGAQATAAAQGDLARQVGMTRAEFERYIETAGRAEQAVTTGAAAQQSATQKTLTEVQRLRAEYVALRDSGVATAQALAEAQSRLLKAQKEAAGGAAEASIRVEEAFATLGITAQAKLEALATNAKTAFETIRTSGIASSEDIKAAFLAYAKAQLATVENSEEWKKRSVQVSLEVQASVLNVRDAFDALINKVNETDEELEDLADTAEAVEASWRNADGSLKAAAESAETTGGSFQILADEAHSLSAAGEAVWQSLAPPSGWIDPGEARAWNALMAEFNAATEAELAWASQVQAAFDRIGRGGAEAAAAREELRALAAAGNYFGETLTAAGEAARQKLREVEDQARSARDSLTDLASGLRDELDRLRGAEAEIEARRFARQLEQIAELERQGGEATAREAAEARQLAETLHRQKLDQIAEEKAARRDREVETGRPVREATGGGLSAVPTAAAGFDTAGLGRALGTLEGTLKQVAGELAKPRQPITLNVSGDLSSQAIRDKIVPELNKVMRLAS